MKKLVLAILLMATVNSFAQKKLTIEKGTWKIGGQTTLSHNKTKRSDPDSDYKSFYWSLTPNIGYAISKNTLLGVQLGYTHSDNGDDNYSDSYKVGMSVKKYFPVSKKFSFNITSRANFSWGDNNLSQSFKRFFIGFTPEISYFLTENFALEAEIGSLGYSNHKNKTDSEYIYTSDSFALNLNSSDIQFGVSYYF
jgi:hypothetical protein